MKFRRSAPIALILFALALWVLWLNRGRWQPLLFTQFDAIANNAPLLEGLSALIDIGGFLLNTAVTILGFLLLYRRPDQDAASEPIRATTVDELRKRLGRGGQVNWIDRQTAHPDLLVSHRRLVITGRMKLGKTREAIELIRRAVAHDLVPSDRIYVPGPTLPFLNPDTLRDLLRRTVDPQAPLLLFIDDLPYHYHGDALEQLVAALTALSHTKATYIVATAREDQLTSEHNVWFRQLGFHTLSLSPLDQAQTARLVDSAAGTFNLQVDETARAAFVAAGDGTPELILINFRRLDADGITQVDEATAQQTARHSLGEAWAAARADILKRYPEVDHIFSALAAFHTAGVTPYRPLVLAFAVHLWRKQPRPAPPWHRYRLYPLRQTLAYLAHFDIVVQRDQVNYPDFVAEEQPERQAAALELAPFLLSYRRLFHRPLLRRLYPHAEAHMWALFDVAEEMYSLQQLDVAIRFYTRALRFTPHSGIHNNRGIAYRQQGNLTAAIADYTRAIVLDPKYATAYNNRGAAFHKQGNLTVAITDYSQAIVLEPDEPSFYTSRGIIYKTLGDLRSAIADFTHVIALDPDSASAYNDRGIALAKQGDLAAAIADFTQAIALEPDKASVYTSRGFAYKNLGDLTSAIADFTQAIAHDPDEDIICIIYMSRGIAYSKEGNLAAAIADCTEAIAHDPDNALAYASRAIVYSKEGNLAAAIADYTQAIAHDPDNALAYASRAIAYRDQGELVAAISDFTRVIALDPDHASTYHNRGLAYYKQGELAASVADFTQAIAFDPDLATVYNNRGVAYRQVGQLDHAMTDFNQALELAPENDWYLYSRGLTSLVLDRLEPAAADLNRAIEVARQRYSENPQDWRNTLNLALYHLAASNAATAEQLYNEALAAPPVYLHEAIQDFDDFLHHFPKHDQALRLRTLLQDKLDT